MKVLAKTIEEWIEFYNDRGISLDGVDARMYPSALHPECIYIETVDKEKKKLLPLDDVHNVMKLKNGSFTGGMSIKEMKENNMHYLPEEAVLDEENEEEVGSSIITVKNESPVDIPEMMEFIQRDGITLNGKKARIGMAFMTESDPLPIIVEMGHAHNPPEFFIKSWILVRYVLDNLNGQFAEDDLDEYNEEYSPNNPPKIKVAVEDILKLAEESTTITLDNHPAEIKFLNKDRGIVKCKDRPMSVAKEWSLIYDVITNHLCKFFLNDTNKYKKDNQFTRNSSYGTLHAPLYDCMASHKKTKEEFSKLLYTLLERRKEDAFKDVQYIYKELNKLEILMDLCKEKHGSTSLSQ